MSGYLLIDPGPLCAVVRLDDGVIEWAKMWSPGKVVLAIPPADRPAIPTVIVENTQARAEPLGKDLHTTIQIAGWLVLEGHYHYTRNQVLSALRIPGGSKASCRAAVLDAWREDQRRRGKEGQSDLRLLNSRLCRHRKRKDHHQEDPTWSPGTRCSSCPRCGGSGYEHVAPLAALRGPGSHFFDCLALWASHEILTK